MKFDVGYSSKNMYLSPYTIRINFRVPYPEGENGTEIPMYVCPSICRRVG